MSTTLPQRLRLLRGEMPQAEFAARVGIHKSSWGRYERGVGEPTASDLARLCAVCGVTPLWLLRGEGVMRPGGADEVPAAAGRGHESETPLPAEQAQAEHSLRPLIPAAATPSDTPAQSVCRQCLWLEKRLDQSESERRELAQENRRLWRENSELRERVAWLEARAGYPGDASVAAHFLPEKRE